MRGPRDHRGDLDDDEDESSPTPTPIWKRRGVLILGCIVIVVLVFIFAHKGTPTAPATNPQNSAIAVTQPYEGPPPIKVAAAAPVAPSPQPAPAPPAIPLPSFPLIGAKPDKPATHAGMVSYPIHIDRPKEGRETAPKEPDKTRLKFAAADLPGRKASPAVDETYILMPGLLPCTLDVAIDSNLPGPLLCHLPGPVYSPKGTLLMEAETQVIGKYESMKQNGVNRLEAVSTYARTPNGIWVPLSGQPLADDLGRTGLSGSIDHRYVERFGGAVLLDLAKSSLEIIQSKVSKGGNTYFNSDSSDQLANQVLQSTINLPPILTKNQGSAIAIWLTEPISFRDSYRNEAAR